MSGSSQSSDAGSRDRTPLRKQTMTDNAVSIACAACIFLNENTSKLITWFIFLVAVFTKLQNKIGHISNTKTNAKSGLRLNLYKLNKCYELQQNFQTHYKTSKTYWTICKFDKPPSKNVANFYFLGLICIMCFNTLIFLMLVHTFVLSST